MNFPFPWLGLGVDSYFERTVTGNRPNEHVGDGPRAIPKGGAIPDEIDPAKLSLPDVMSRFRSMLDWLKSSVRFGLSLPNIRIGA